jgi:hypothetical protein
MNIFDFLTQEELDDAPEDRALAFTHLVRIAQSRLRIATHELNDRDDDDRERLDDARYGFMNTVVSLGKSLDIEPFKSMDMPRYENFDYGVHRQFRADLDHYMAQLVIGNTIRARGDSVAVSEDVKSRIRAHIHHIKQHIDKAEVSDAKRAALHAKLAAFETALEKDRVNVMVVGGMLIGLLAASANVATLADSPTFQKLVSNVMKDVAEAKAVDDEIRRLPPHDPPIALLPARRNEPPRPVREEFSADLDDEIPF